VTSSGVWVDAGGGADTVIGGAGADTLTGGEGADHINGGSDGDTIVLTETSSARDTVFIADLASADTVIGFNVTAANATEDLLVFDFSEIEGVTGDYVYLDDASSLADSSVAPLFEVITGGTDLGAITTDGAILIANLAGNITDVAALGTALEINGNLELTVNSDWAAGDTFLAAFDDGVDTYIAKVVVGGNGAADDETFAAGELTATLLVKLSGISDVTTLAATNFDFIA
jgi:hypothetical protein